MIFLVQGVDMILFNIRLVGLAMLCGVAVMLVGCGGDSTKDKDKDDKKVTKTDKDTSSKAETPYIATIPHLEDEGCVANIRKEVMKLDGVASVECNIPAKKATITPKPGAKLSPRELWEALDRSGEAASKLDGPSGLFTSKPEK
jgi:copper chaperone CopZ